MYRRGVAKNREEPTVPLGDALIEILDRYKPEHECPICHGEDWEVNVGASLPIAHFAKVGRGFRTIAPAVSLPFGVVSCAECGYTYFVNLSLLAGRGKL